MNNQPHNVTREDFKRMVTNLEKSIGNINKRLNDEKEECRKRFLNITNRMNEIDDEISVNNCMVTVLKKEMEEGFFYERD